MELLDKLALGLCLCYLIYINNKDVLPVPYSISSNESREGAKIIIESMDIQNIDDIIILGDSIFKNNTHVDEKQSVEFLLNKKIETDIVFLAQDGAMINDVATIQLPKIPAQIKNNITYIYWSVGGNDILESMLILDDKNIIYDIFAEYEKLATTLLDKFPQAFIKLCTIYYPTDDKIEKYHPLITTWNGELQRLVKKYNTKKIQLFETDKYLFAEKHFTNSIEPSFSGGKAIVANIVKNISSD